MPVDAEILKEATGIAEVCQQFWPEAALGREGSFTCPFCGRPKKLSVHANEFFKCHHPACGMRGDIFDLLVQGGKAASFAEAVRLVEAVTQGLAPTASSPSGLTALWTKMQQLLHNSPQALDYCQQRRLPTSLVGYHPPGLLTDGAHSTKRLEEMGLLVKGREFLAGRVIFPLFSSTGQLLHLQGRSLQEDGPRWLSTARPTGPKADDCLFNHAAVAEAHSRNCPLFLAEGATDTLALQGLGLPTLGVPGVQIALHRHRRLLSKSHALIAIFDNDTFPVFSPRQGEYKSWAFVLPQLVELACHLPELPILCIVPPSQPELVDVNDWVRQGADARTLVAAAQQAPTLQEFVLQQLQTHPDLLSPALQLLDISDSGYAAHLRSQLSGQDIVTLLRQLV
jgi:hypothetical protein